MENVKFVLKEPRGDRETPIYLIARFDYQRFKYSTEQKIRPELWDFENQSAIEDKNHEKLKDLHRKISKEEITRNSTLNGILAEYKQYFLRISDNLKLNKTIPTPELYKEEFDKKFRPKRLSANKVLTLNQYIDQYIKDIESGTRLTEKDKKRYAYSTVKNFKGFKSQFEEFQKDKQRKYNFNDITFDFYSDFISYFTSKNYSPNTIGRHIRDLKIIMKTAKENGFHSNSNTEQKKFRSISVPSDQIYLNENEINRIYELDLSDEPEFDIARDVFLVGCYTALRFSDYSRIKKEHIQKTAKGTKVIDIITKKTGERVVIPIHPNLKNILKKYNNCLPKTYEQKVNFNIKKVGKLAGIEEDIPTSKVLGGLTVNKTVKKYELIQTHTARRSGATNMYKAGIPSIDIMKQTGHKTENNFLKYIKVSKEETADKLAKTKYFNPTKVLRKAN